MNLQHAFDEVCKNAQKPECHYVCLMQSVPFYGGPQEGGWWGNDTFLVAFQQFPTEELAEAAATEVRKLAKESTDEANREYGQHCLNQLEYLDNRGLDADFFPEDDGPEKFYVIVSDELPQESRGCRHYE